MKTKIGNISIDWLLATGAQCATPIDESLSIHRLDYPVPPEIGSARLEILDLNDGFKLYRAMHHFEKAPFGELVPLLDLTESGSAPIFSAQIFLSGIACHHEYDQGRSKKPVEIWGRTGVDTFRLRRDWDARVLIGGGGLTEMRSLCLPLLTLTSLLGESVESRLLEQLGLDQSTCTITRPMPPHLNIPLAQAMSGQYVGPARRLFAQSKALEYLGGLVDFLHAEDDVDITIRRHTPRIRKLRDNLLLLEGRIPTLGELATDFGLSAKQLNIEFKSEFGQSIFEYVTSKRLEQAHEALLVSDRPMKVLAERLGYSHVNHFITAFKRKFGYTPGSLKKRSVLAA